MNIKEIEKLRKEGKILVCTDNDYFNSADGSDFNVQKGDIKLLPEELTPIIENALEQKLIREVTEKDIIAFKEKHE